MANTAPTMISPDCPKSLKAIVEAPTIKGKLIGAFPENDLTHFIHSLILTHHKTKDPFYVLDLAVVAKLMDTWTNSLPTVRPFYAVKCNPDRALLAAMAELGAGFDCASRAEIEAVLELGVKPSRIVFANPCKIESHIKFAAKVGVDITTFDSASEIEKVRRNHPNCSLILRVKSPEDAGAEFPLDSKYGAEPEEVEPLLKSAQSARLPVIGVAFHVGSGASNTRAYVAGIGAARRVFDAAARLNMAPMRVVDIGGGFMAGSTFKDAASDIKEAISTHFPDTTGLSFIAEPGRFFCEPAFTLAAMIIGKRVRGEKREYWLNDGVYGSLMSNVVFEMAGLTCMVLACHSSLGNLRCEGAKLFSSTVFGPTCDSVDTVFRAHWLPELEVNDWLVFPKLGAYSSALRSGFNGFNTHPYSTYLACSNSTT